MGGPRDALFGAITLLAWQYVSRLIAAAHDGDAQVMRDPVVHGALGLAGGAGQWVLICLRHRFSSDLRLRSSSLIRHLPELV